MGTVVILSGGMDSAVLAWKLHKQYSDLECLGFDYGQRHVKELDYARALADRLGVRWSHVSVPSLRTILQGSSQTSSDVEVPQGHFEDESMKQTVVPNRNMILLSIAAGYAVSRGHQLVAYAAHAGDRTIYPDCRVEFVSAMDEAMRLGNLWTPVRLYAPFVFMNKGELVVLGQELGVPFELTWTCYAGREKHCGRCGACQERIEAFASANVIDPTEYE